jgi:DNA-binding NarL/FixJ family response regulator
MPSTLTGNSLPSIFSLPKRQRGACILQVRRMSALQPIRVLIVAGIRLYREGLAQVLESAEWIASVVTASTAEQAIQYIREPALDIVLLDLAIPGARDVIEEAVHLRSDSAGGLHSSTKIVALAVDDADEALISAAEAGVSGYVPRDGSLDDLLAAIRHAQGGEFKCSPGVAGRLVARVQTLAMTQSPSQSDAPLSGRELEVARLLDDGLSNKEIAARLWIEESTVKNHVHSILNKLGVHRRGEAAARIRPLLVRRHLASPPLPLARQ